MNSFFNKVLRKVLRHLPFKIKYYFDRKYFKNIDEVSLVYQYFRNKTGKSFTMIDVGAHWGTTLLPFANIGWQVYAFEPDKKNRVKLIENTKALYNLEIDERAVLDKDGLVLSFYDSDLSTGISGLSNFHPSHREAYTVETITLSKYIKDSSIEKVDFLKIDTEGFDLFVLQGYNWENEKMHPKVIVCEYDENKTRHNNYTVNDMIELLLSKNYEVVISSWYPLENYGSGHQWKEFLFTKNKKALHENLSWGNLIAYKNVKLDDIRSYFS